MLFSGDSSVTTSISTAGNLGLYTGSSKQIYLGSSTNVTGNLSMSGNASANQLSTTSDVTVGGNISLTGTSTNKITSSGGICIQAASGKDIYIAS